MITYWRSDKYKLDFLGIPKTGSTSVRKMLDIHPEKGVSKGKTKGYTSFTVLRSPFKRAISAYYECLRRGTLKAGSSFDDYLYRIVNEGYFDNHTLPMVNCFEVVDYIFILELGLKKQISQLTQGYLLQEEKENTSSERMLLTDMQYKVIESIYKKDVELYSYHYKQQTK